MTAQEIMEFLQGIHESADLNRISYFLEDPNEFHYGDLIEGFDEDEIEEGETPPPTFNKILEVLGAFDSIEFQRTGGDYDGASHVVHFKDHDCYIEFIGWYASHHGFEFEEWREVTPVEVTITTFEPK